MSHQGQQVAQSFDWQRKMLDELAALQARGERPIMLSLSHTLGIAQDTVRRCLQWLEFEGFVKLTMTSSTRADIELLASPDDDELRAAIAGRKAKR